MGGQFDFIEYIYINEPYYGLSPSYVWEMTFLGDYVHLGREDEKVDQSVS